MSPSLVMMPDDTFDFQCVVNCDGNSKVVAATIVIIDEAGAVITIAAPVPQPLYNGAIFTYTYDKLNDTPLVAGKTYRWYVRFYQTSTTSPEATLINIPMSYGYIRNFEQAINYHTLETLKADYDNNFLIKFIASTETVFAATSVTAPNYLIKIPTSAGIADNDIVRYWTRNGASALTGLTIDNLYTVNIDSVSGQDTYIQLYSNNTLVAVTSAGIPALSHYITRPKVIPALSEIRDTLIALKSGLSDLFATSTITQQESISKIIEKCNDLLGDMATDDNSNFWKSKYVEVSTMMAALLLLYAAQHSDWETYKANPTRWYISQKDEFETGMYLLFNFSEVELAQNASYHISNLVGKYYKITGFNKEWFYINLKDVSGSLASLTSVTTLKSNLAGARYTVFSTYIESPTAYFKVISDPTLDITLPADYYNPTIPVILQNAGVGLFYNSATITCTGSYTQTEGVSWKGFYFELWKHVFSPSSDTLIATSTTKYNGAIEASFTGLEKNLSNIANIASINEYYYLKLKIIDTNDNIISFSDDGAKFVICYSTSTTATKPTLSYNESKSAAQLGWTLPTEPGIVISSWEIYKRKKTNEVWPSTFDFVVSLDAAARQLYDANVCSNGEYQYRIFPIINDSSVLKTGAPYPDSDIVEMSNWDIDLFNIIPTNTPDVYYVDTTNFWRFELDIAFGPMVQNIDKTVYSSLSKYPKVSTGMKNYYTGDLNCYLSDVYALEQKLDTFEKQNKFREFVNDGKLKILKDRKGHVLLIDILTCQFTTNYNLTALPITVSLTWVQIGDTTDLKIIYQ